MADFEEQHAAAQSLKNGWTRMASTVGLIRVTLQDEVLRVTAVRTPVRWVLALMLFDLDHSIPVQNILSVEREGTYLGRGKLVVAFRDGSGKERRVRLFLKQDAALLEALQARGAAVRG